MRHIPHQTLLFLLLLAGFMLRLALHDYHGLEGDDGFSLAVSRYDTADLLAGLARLELDIHPPLHFLALKGWAALTGESLLALRLMNILADLLTGALLMRLAGQTFGRQTAVIAGALWLFAPLLLYATYLIRMYSLLALLTTAGAACLVEARRRPYYNAGAALFGLLAAQTHIIGGLVLAALGLAALLDSRRSLRHIFITGAAFGLAGLLCLPYAASVWALYQSGRPLGAEIAEATFHEPFSALLTIIQTAVLHRLPFSLLLLLLLAVILASALRESRRSLALLALTVTLLAGLTGLAWLAGMYKARYLTPIAPLLLVWLGAGVARLRTALAMPAAALLLAVISVSGVVHDLQRDYRDDWTAAADFIHAHERPGDTIIVIPDWGQEAFRFHYAGAAPVTGIFPQVSTDVDLGPTLEALITGHSRVWLVRYQPEVSDPEARAEAWLLQRGPLITEAFPGGMHIKAYDLQPRRDSLPAAARPLDAVFDDQLALRGVDLPVTQGSARDNRLHPPSNWVQVILYWEALQPGPTATPRVRFTDSIGQTYGAALEREHDLPRRVPVSQWQPGDIWQAAYDLNLNPDTPPGVYNIEVMALDESANPLPANGADAGDFWVIAGQFRVD